MLLVADARADADGAFIDYYDIYFHAYMPPLIPRQHTAIFIGDVSLCAWLSPLSLPRIAGSSMQPPYGAPPPARHGVSRISIFTPCRPPAMASYTWTLGLILQAHFRHTGPKPPRPRQMPLITVYFLPQCLPGLVTRSSFSLTRASQSKPTRPRQESIIIFYDFYFQPTFITYADKWLFSDALRCFEHFDADAL